MKNILKSLFLSIFILAMPIAANADVDMSGNAVVNVTSDTADSAKTSALNQARKQVLQNLVYGYVEDQKKLDDVIQNSNDNDLLNLVSSVSIESEQQSSTTYSANIKISLDSTAVKKWLDSNEIKNWLGNSDNNATITNKIYVIFDVNGGMRDWIEINKIARDAKQNMIVNNISNNQVSVNISSENRLNFISAFKSMGWKSSESADNIRIWK